MTRRGRVFVSVVAIASAALTPVTMFAWGAEGHRLITRRAIEGLPADLRPFFAADRDFVVERSIDPDLWRILDLRTSYGPEGLSHYFEIDDLGSARPFADVPRTRAAFEAKYGRTAIARVGQLPFRVGELYADLVTSIRESNGRAVSAGANNARYIAAILAHYIEDGYQPLHAVTDTDGQKTRQTGIHSRFETELVRRNLNALRLSPVEISPVGDPTSLAFDVVIESEALVSRLLDADRRARAGRPAYDDGYYVAFFDNARPILEARLGGASSTLASLLASAWREAARPPATPGVRTPVR